MALGLALAAAALYLATETVRSHRRTAARLVRDYGAFAAWSYRHHATEALRTGLRRSFVPVVHADAGAPPAGSLTAATWRAALAADAALAPCGACELPSYHFRQPLGGAPMASAPGAEFAGEPVDDATRRWIASTVAAHAAGPSRPEGDFALVRAGDGARERTLVYTVVGSDSAAPLAYGFELEPARLAPLFRALFATGQLLPPVVTGTRRNPALLGVELRGPDGAVVYRSSDPARWAATSRDRLEAQLGGFEVRAAVLRTAAASLAGEGLPGARLPLVAGLLALAGGLAAVAVHQMRRDAELTRLRTDFVASVSHELRTPLAQVQLFLDTLRLGRFRTEAQREWILDGMQRETTRLTTLVDNVLHFARAERAGPDDGDGAREPTVLDEYLRDVIADFAPLAGARGTTVEVQCEPGLVAGLHRESFRRVLLNLLDNAVKYGPERGTVRVAATGAAGCVRIMVEDRGPGVDPREAAVIFEPFRRGAQAVGSVTVGSGIGLSVARDIVDAHGGRIGVEPNPSGGARFVIELPGGWEPAPDHAANADVVHDTARGSR